MDKYVVFLSIIYDTIRLCESMFNITIYGNFLFHHKTHKKKFARKFELLCYELVFVTKGCFFSSIKNKFKLIIDVFHLLF